jgi:hypothetical protein
LVEAQEIFDQVYLVDQRSDDPEQFRAIGWCRGRLCSVIFEIRHDAEGEYLPTGHGLESDLMPKTSKRALSVDQIAEKASRGEDISAHFTNRFTVVRPVRRVNVDLTEGLLRELDQRAARLNISRQRLCEKSSGNRSVCRPPGLAAAHHLIEGEQQFARDRDQGHLFWFARRH